MKYYLKEFAPNRWTIHHAETGHAIYDDEPDGNDRVMIWADEDAAYDCLQRLNRIHSDET